MADKIKLQVGEREFITMKQTLVGESSYFASLFSGRWQNQEDENGALFIDSDPELFAEVLRYLHSGNYPLFFDSGSNTFDYAKYSALLGEAQYFGIPKLETWIRAREFHKVVKREKWLYITEECEQGLLRAGTPAGDRQVECSFFQTTKKVYQCPRGIESHDSPQSCGRRCKAIQGDAEPEYKDEDVFTLIEVETRRIFNPDACLGANVNLSTET